MNTAVEPLVCPTCGNEYLHLSPTELVHDSGIRSVGRADERVGLRVLATCEVGHPFFLGLAEHKGALYFYIRESADGEVGIPYRPDFPVADRHDFVVIDDDVDPQIPWEGNLTSLEKKVVA